MEKDCNANHAKTLKDDRQLPPMDVMAEAVGACLCDSGGHRLFKKRKKQYPTRLSFVFGWKSIRRAGQTYCKRTLQKQKNLSQPDRRFLFRLAAQIGRADVDAMAEEP